MSQDNALTYAQNRTELGQNRCNPRTALAVMSGSPSLAQAKPGHWDELLPGESAKAFQAFMDYAEAGPSRSLRKLLEHYVQTPRAGKAVQPPARSLATLSKWSARYQWRRRALEYDYEQQEIRRVQMREIRLSRQEQLAEQDWRVSQELRRVSNEVLDEAFKFFRSMVTRSPATRDSKGNIIGPERVIQTVAIKTRDALTAAKLASELGRLAAEMPTSNMRFDTDFARMSDSQLLEFLARHLAGAPNRDHSTESAVTQVTTKF